MNWTISYYRCSCGLLFSKKEPDISNPFNSPKCIWNSFVSLARTRLPIKHTAMSNKITVTNVINASTILHLPSVLDIQEKEIRLGESQDVILYTRISFVLSGTMYLSRFFCAIRHSHRHFCQAHSLANGS